jgi:omega-6 fatty acid desaturase (delta-12 desaturase)
MDFSPPIRSSQEILNALKPFACEDRGRSWREVLVTVVPLGACLSGAALLQWWPLRCLFAVAAGLLMVRSFILFHDFMHGAILRNSKPARILMYGLGALMLTPPRSWRESHNHHHAHVGRIGSEDDESETGITTDIGAFPLLSTHMWRKASWAGRFRYRFIRHPLTIACAYLTVFLISICLGSLFKNPRKHWPSGLVLLGHLAYLAALGWAGGWAMLFFAGLLPLWIASATGAYLFYAQHSFPGVRVFTPDEWNFVQAALETASYLKTGRVMEWITGCIGYHHIHHLNSSIPFYRLREAMASAPEVQHPTITRLRFRDMAGCFRANLWDPQNRRLVSYRDAMPGAAG